MFFEFLLFIVAILIAWRYTHKSKTRAAIAAILFISSILTWISHSLAEYNINTSAQRMIAIFLLFVALGVLSSNRRKKSIAWKKRRGLRRQFSVREQVLKHQKYKCEMVERDLLFTYF
jgi:high-affinity Fe2+/Pb2+ permease